MSPEVLCRTFIWQVNVRSTCCGGPRSRFAAVLGLRDRDRSGSGIGSGSGSGNWIGDLSLSGNWGEIRHEVCFWERSPNILIGIEGRMVCSIAVAAARTCARVRNGRLKVNVGGEVTKMFWRERKGLDRRYHRNLAHSVISFDVPKHRLEVRRVGNVAWGEDGDTVGGPLERHCSPAE